MPIGFADIWDFHTDLRYMVNLAPGKAYLAEQIDLPAARRLGRERESGSVFKGGPVGDWVSFLGVESSWSGGTLRAKCHLIK